METKNAPKKETPDCAKTHDRFLILLVSHGFSLIREAAIAPRIAGGFVGMSIGERKNSWVPDSPTYS